MTRPVAPRQLRPSKSGPTEPRHPTRERGKLHVRCANPRRQCRASRLLERKAPDSDGPTIRSIRTRFCVPFPTGSSPQLNSKPGDRVIDVGCGCGATTIEFGACVSPGGEVLGLDISEPMLARARERAPQDLPIRFERADATVYDFAPNADLAASRFGVMFFADPARSFGNLRRGLKADGRLVFACCVRPSRTLADPAAAGSRQARPSAARNGPRSAGPLRFRKRGAGAANPEGRRLRQHRADAARSRSRHRGRPRPRDGGPRRDDDRADKPDARRPERSGSTAATASIRKALAAQARGDSVPLGAAIWIVTATNPAG